jgi:hypothetical protein
LKVTLVGGNEKPDGEYNKKTPPKAALILCWKIHLVKMNVFACKTTYFCRLTRCVWLSEERKMM